MSTPRLFLTPEQAAFVDEVRAYLAALEADPALDLDAVQAEFEHDSLNIGPEGRAFLRRLGADGWLGVGWPTEYGGQGRSHVEQWLFLEEMAYQGLPSGNLTTSSIAPTLIRVGNDEQKERYVGGIQRGEYDFAIGYSEPDAGTDLASLRTRAVVDGDRYVVRGEKVFTTGAHVATHLWLAARTGTPESRHRGVSLFIVPMDAPGITVRPMMTQADERTNQVLLDDVEVPASDRVGEENGGWRAIMAQLDMERLFTYSVLRRQLEDLVAWHHDSPPAGDRDRHLLAELAAEVEAVRLLAFRAALMMDAGLVPEAEASMAKIRYSETRQRLALESLRTIGPLGQVRYGEPGSALGGRPERALRGSTVYKFGAGTNELQRSLIAARGLGLPA